MRTPPRSRATVTLCAMALTGAVALAGCGGQDAAPAGASGTGPVKDVWPTDDADAAQASNPTTEQTPDGEGDSESEDGGSEDSGLPEGTRTRTEQQATRFIQTYARPPAKAKVTEKAWWTAVRPYLNDAAAKKLKTAPAKVPFTTQTSEPVVTRVGESPDLTATVGTDKGQWVVVFESTTDERLLVKSLTEKNPKKEHPKPAPKKKDEPKKKPAAKAATKK